MKIGINAHLLSPDESYRAAGVSNYTEHLLRGLGHEDKTNDYQIFVGPWARDITKTQSLNLGSNFLWKPSRCATNRVILRFLWEQLLQPLHCKNLDVVHGLVNVVPLAGVASASRVVTIHDLVFLLFSDKHPAMQRRYLEIMTRASVGRSRYVIAVSENTRQDVIRLLHAPPEKVITVPEAAGPEFMPLPADQVENFRSKRGLPERFFFYLGTLEPRKNIPALLRGYAHLRNEQSDVPSLVIAGPKGWLYDEIFTLVRELELESHVTFPGFVPRDELTLWFNAALCFIYLSEYEGFGLPPLQAMACGVPVIVNNVSSLPEVVGEAGLLVAANDASEVSLSLRRLCDPSEHHFWSQVALERAREFSWQRAARETLQIYRMAHEATPSKR